MPEPTTVASKNAVPRNSQTSALEESIVRHLAGSPSPKSTESNCSASRKPTPTCANIHVLALMYAPQTELRFKILNVAQTLAPFSRRPSATRKRLHDV